MATARERYEAKTKVVTFRVPSEVYDQMEEVKARTGLSNADFMKLGTGIAQDEVKAKLVKLSGLEDRRAQLTASVREEQRRLNQFTEEERRRRLEELDTEMQAFRLFDRGWRVEAVSCKLGISQKTISHYFDEWAKERGDKQAAETELMRRCLRKHIDRLETQRIEGALSHRLSKEGIKELEGQIESCQRLLADPSKISKEDKEFLFAEYWSRSWWKS
jgi:predicted transcriptional regulator